MNIDKGREVLEKLKDPEYYSECKSAATKITTEFRDSLIAEFRKYLTNEDIEEMRRTDKDMKNATIMYALALHGLCFSPKLEFELTTCSVNYPSDLKYLSCNKYLVPWLCEELGRHGVYVKPQSTLNPYTKYSTSGMIIAVIEGDDYDAYYRTCERYNYLTENAVRKIEEERGVRRR